MTSIFYHHILDCFLLFCRMLCFAVRIAYFLAKCSFNFYVTNLYLYSTMTVQVVSMPVNKSYSVLWLKTDRDMPNLLNCIHSGDLPQKLFWHISKEEILKATGSSFCDVSACPDPLNKIFFYEIELLGKTRIVWYKHESNFFKRREQLMPPNRECRETAWVRWGFCSV